jgi:hypothetical protein
MNAYVATVWLTTLMLPPMSVYIVSGTPLAQSKLSPLISGK